jgi:hypothetical protein
MGDMAARTLAIQPPIPVMSDAMAILADATREDKKETTVVTTVARSEPINETAVAIADVIMPPIMVNVVAKNPATAEMIGASAVTIIVPNDANAPRMPVTMVVQNVAMAVPTAAKADATT